MTNFRKTYLLKTIYILLDFPTKDFKHFLPLLLDLHAPQNSLLLELYLYSVQ